MFLAMFRFFSSFRLDVLMKEVLDLKKKVSSDCLDKYGSIPFNSSFYSISERLDATDSRRTSSEVTISMDEIEVVKLGFLPVSIESSAKI